MPAIFKCNECSFETKVKDELAGKKIKCPKCKAVGTVGEGTKAVPSPEDESSADLMAVNLNSFQDVEVPEGEVLDESQVPQKPKAKKKKKKGKSLDSTVKLAAIGFSLLSFLVIGGLVYTIGPTVMEKYQQYIESRNSDGEPPPKGEGGAPVPGAGQPAAPAA